MRKYQINKTFEFCNFKIFLIESLKIKNWKLSLKRITFHLQNLDCQSIPLFLIVLFGYFLVYLDLNKGRILGYSSAIQIVNQNSPKDPQTPINYSMVLKCY